MARFPARLRKLVPRKKTALGIGGGVLLLVVLLIGSAEYTSRPQFCTSCHYMEPFYKSWQASSHADVTCVKCHFPPGLAGTVRGKMEGLLQVAEYLTQSYVRRKPWAEIGDDSCLQSGCHDTRMLQDSMTFQNVTFAHQPHLETLRRGKKLRCTSCHSQIVQGEHILVTETSCFLCHFKESDEILPASFQTLSDCKTCHREAPVPTASGPQPRFDHTDVQRRDIDCTRCHNHTIMGDGVVPDDNCLSCHFEPTYLDRFNDTEFLHTRHITEHKIECTQCHLRIQHKIQRLTVENELACENCHTSTHREQLLLFTGAAEGGAEGVVNPMFEAGLDCASCHVFHEPLIGEGTVRTAKPQSCEECHGKGYDRLLKLWQEASDKKLNELKQAITRVEGSLRNAAPGTAEAVRPLIRQARNGLHVVEVGKAVHNVAYADQIIKAGYDNLRQAVGQARVNVTLPAFEPAPVPGECANCHAGIETISRTFAGKTFSHATHAAERRLACTTCHSNARRHGELTITATGCNACHHQPPAEQRCASCHETAGAVYAGTFLSHDTPDVMFEAEVTCADCHVQKKQVVKPTVQVCVDCHDEDYREMAGEWMQDVQASLAAVKDLLRQVEQNPGLRNTAAYRQARQAVQQIEESGGAGLHNNDLILKVLQETRRSLQNLTSGA